MKKFWLFVCRFAYRRCADPVPETPVGLPQMRDPKARCEYYAPRPAAFDFTCGGDGHYLCKECAHWTKREGEDYERE